MAACEQIQEELSAYLDGEVSPQERATLDAHLKDCADCRSMLELLKSTSEAVSDLPKLKAPASLADKIRAEIEHAPAKAPIQFAAPEPTRSYWAPMALSIAAMVMLCVVVFLVLPTIAEKQKNDRAAMVAPAAEASKSEAPKEVEKLKEAAEGRDLDDSRNGNLQAPSEKLAKTEEFKNESKKPEPANKLELAQEQQGAQKDFGGAAPAQRANNKERAESDKSVAAAPAPAKPEAPFAADAPRPSAAPKKYKSAAPETDRNVPSAPPATAVAPQPVPAPVLTPTPAPPPPAPKAAATAPRPNPELSGTGRAPAREAAANAAAVVENVEDKAVAQKKANAAEKRAADAVLKDEKAPANGLLQPEPRQDGKDKFAQDAVQAKQGVAARELQAQAPPQEARKQLAETERAKGEITRGAATKAVEAVNRIEAKEAPGAAVAEGAAKPQTAAPKPAGPGEGGARPNDGTMAAGKADAAKTGGTPATNGVARARRSTDPTSAGEQLRQAEPSIGGLGAGAGKPLAAALEPVAPLNFKTREPEALLAKIREISAASKGKIEYSIAPDLRSKNQAADAGGGKGNATGKANTYILRVPTGQRENILAELKKLQAFNENLYRKADDPAADKPLAMRDAKTAKKVADEALPEPAKSSELKKVAEELKDNAETEVIEIQIEVLP